MSNKADKSLTQYVEELVSHGDMTYIDAVIDYCEKYNLDPQKVKGLLSKSIKQKIQAEAVEYHFVQSTNQTLPFE